MNKLFTFLDKNLDTLAKLIVLITAFSSVLLNGLFGLAKYGSIFNYSLFLLFILYVGAYVLVRRDSIPWKDKTFILILAFLAVHVISILLNGGKIHNAKLFIITALQLLVLFLFVKDHKPFMNKVLEWLNYSVFVATFISLVLFCLNIIVTNYVTRYCGVYQNPNLGSMIAMLSIGITIILFNLGNKKKKIFYIFNIMVQIILIRLCMSRATQVALIVFIVFATFTYSLLLHRKFLCIARNLIMIVAAFAIFCYVSVPTLYTVRDIIANEPTSLMQETNKRDEKQAEESNNYRYLLITCGFKSALDKPILGHGNASLPASVSSYSTIKLDGIEGGGVHNGYLQLFITNGVLGFICYAGVHILLLWGIFKKRKAIFALTSRKDILYFSGFLALYFSILAYSLFESVLFSSTFITTMLVISAGGLRYDD